MKKKPLIIGAILLGGILFFRGNKPFDNKEVDTITQEPTISIEAKVPSYVVSAPSLITFVSPTPIPTLTPTPTPTPTPTFTPTLTPKVEDYWSEEIDTSKHHKKIYTDYRAVTDKKSRQYALLQLSQTDSRTGIRVVLDDNNEWRYCVALGNYWADNHIGKYVDFHMVNGAILKCIVCDVKQDIHTMGKARKYGSAANDLIEFYIDSSALKTVDYYFVDGKAIPLKYPAGDVSHAGEEFKGGIKLVIVHNKCLKGFEK